VLFKLLQQVSLRSLDRASSAVLRRVPDRVRASLVPASSYSGAKVAQSQRIGLPRALFVIGTQVGGTPQTNKDLMAAFAGIYDTYVLHSDARQLTLSRFADGNHETLERARLPRSLQPFPHVDADYDRIIAAWMAAYAFQIIHIRHLVWHSLSLPRIAQSLGVPVVFSFHDYYAICPTVRLVDENDVFCGGDCTATPGPCRQALWKAKNFPPLKHQAVHVWREAMADMLASCDAFVTTSATTRDRMQRFFPVTRQRPFPVIEHGAISRSSIRSGAHRTQPERCASSYRATSRRPRAPAFSKPSTLWTGRAGLNSMCSARLAANCGDCPTLCCTAPTIAPVSAS
jgi:hypothetical protein